MTFLGTKGRLCPCLRVLEQMEQAVHCRKLFPSRKGCAGPWVGLLVAVGSASAASETEGLECFLL